MKTIIRQLTFDDIDLYKSIRLEALENAPYAFGASAEETLAEPERLLNQALTDNPVLGFFQDGALAGMAGYVIDKGIKRKHKAFIWGVYVRPEFRGQGISKKLVEDIINRLPETVEQVRLDVESNNIHAYNVYKNLGFEEYGTEKRALKIGNDYYDEILMVKFLR